jgi:hypothetical protein
MKNLFAECPLARPAGTYGQHLHCSEHTDP